MSLSRREFLRATAVAGAIAAVPFEANLQAGIAGSGRQAGGLIDVNVSLGQWPSRRLPLDETPELARKLRASGVKQAWACSFDALLHKDMGAVNSRLSAECKQHGRGLLVPLGSINPKLPDCEEDLRRCAEVHRMPGIRLYPNYHGYKISDPVFENLLRLATSRKLILQLAASMEDERMQHPLLRVPNVDLSALPDVLGRVPGARVVLLNWFRAMKPDLLARLAERVWFDVAMVEGVAGIETLLKKVPVERIVLGSHAPFYYFEAAAFKLKESQLTHDQESRIGQQNAANLLG